MTAQEIDCPPLDLTVFRQHQAEVRAQISPQPPLDLTPVAHRRLAEFLATYGEERLIRLLDLTGDGGEATEIALKTAHMHTQAGLPCVTVTKYDPRNKNAERRFDVRVITGGLISLSLDAARLS